jgi:hypothetical protein
MHSGGIQHDHLNMGIVWDSATGARFYLSSGAKLATDGLSWAAFSTQQFYSLRSAVRSTVVGGHLNGCGSELHPETGRLLVQPRTD